MNLYRTYYFTGLLHRNFRSQSQQFSFLWCFDWGTLTLCKSRDSVHNTKITLLINVKWNGENENVNEITMCIACELILRSAISNINECEEKEQNISPDCNHLKHSRVKYISNQCVWNVFSPTKNSTLQYLLFHVMIRILDVQKNFPSVQRHAPFDFKRKKDGTDNLKRWLCSICANKSQ